MFTSFYHKMFIQGVQSCMFVTEISQHLIAYEKNINNSGENILFIWYQSFII